MKDDPTLFLQSIKDTIDKENFDAWFKFVHPRSVKDNILTLEVPNSFYRDWLKKNFLAVIQSSAKSVYSDDITVAFTLNSKIIKNNTTSSPEPKKNSPPQNPRKKNDRGNQPNQKYTFNNFIVGSDNQFAHAAALAVGKNPGKIYNPLFIYGAVGLGKTHLLHSIANYALKKNPDFQVSYLSSEHFVNDLINSLQHKRISSFRNRYRTIDMLLVDDIQFISGKERTQEEFFHTFNTLYETHKQIVISSDKFPKEMDGLEERLKSRFSAGLIADIKPPDLETKVAILQQKALDNNVALSSDIAMYIASKTRSNVRELEGCLARVCAFSTLTDTEITMALVKDVLKDLFLDREKPIDIQTIQESVANFFNIKVIDLKSKKRDRRIVIPRQIAMYLSRRLTNISLPQIGKSFGGRDHTTVIHSDTKIHTIVSENSDSDIYKALVQISKNLNCELVC